jgi:hypothetical protein
MQLYPFPCHLVPDNPTVILNSDSRSRHGELCFYNESLKKAQKKSVMYCVLFGYWRQIIQFIASSRFKSQTKPALPR